MENDNMATPTTVAEEEGTAPAPTKPRTFYMAYKARALTVQPRFVFDKDELVDLLTQDRDYKVERITVPTGKRRKQAGAEASAPVAAVAAEQLRELLDTCLGAGHGNVYPPLSLSGGSDVNSANDLARSCTDRTLRTQLRCLFYQASHRTARSDQAQPTTTTTDTTSSQDARDDRGTVHA